MGIDVGLVRHQARRFFLGKYQPVFEELVGDVELPVEDDRYPYIRLIDPYDDTVFSSYQCATIEPDFARLAAERPGPDTLAVLELVRKCARDVSTCLWFAGD